MICKVEGCIKKVLTKGSLCGRHYHQGVSDVGAHFKDIENECMGQKTIPKGEHFGLRLDGKGFSKVVKRLKIKWPYDERLSRVMTETTLRLAKHFQADMAFTMSDEITLIFMGPRVKDKRVFKYVSEVASLCGGLFNAELHAKYPSMVVDLPPYFDCRWFSLKRSEIVGVLKWRQNNEIMNSCSNVVYSHYRGVKQKLIENLTCFDMNKKLVTQKGLEKSWDFYPKEYKYGVLVYKQMKWIKKEPLVKMIKGKLTTIKREAIRTVWVKKAINFQDTLTDDFFKMVSKHIISQ